MLLSTKLHHFSRIKKFIHIGIGSQYEIYKYKIQPMHETRKKQKKISENTKGVWPLA